jgi:hypothetical protein
MFRPAVLSSIFALALGWTCAQAQTNSPPPDSSVAAPAEAQPVSSPGSMGGKRSNKELIASCRSEARAKGLSGDALKSAVRDCVGAQKPKLAARMQCRQQGKAQGISGDELKSFVKNCLNQGK